MVEQKSILVESEQEYTALMVLLDEQGYAWADGETTSEFDGWAQREGEDIFIELWEDKTITYWAYTSNSRDADKQVTAEQYLFEHCVVSTVVPIIESWPW